MTDLTSPPLSFEAAEPTVVVYQRARFLGLGRIRALPDGSKVIAGFTGIYPSRTRSDTDQIIKIIEGQIFDGGIEQGSCEFKKATLSWRVR